MRDFFGRLPGDVYARRIAWAYLALAAVTFFWPFILAPLPRAMGCGLAGGGGCGALALVIFIFTTQLVKVAYAILVAAAIWWSVPRLRDAGQSQHLILALVIALLPAMSFWSLAGSLWSMGLDMHIGNGVTPTVTAGLACILAIALLPSEGVSTITKQPAASLLGWMVVAQAALAIVPTTITWAMKSVATAHVQLPRWVWIALTATFAIVNFLTAAVPAAVVYFGYRHHKQQVRTRSIKTYTCALLIGLVSLAALMNFSYVLSNLLGLLSSKDMQFRATIVNYICFAQLFCLLALLFMIGRGSNNAPDRQSPLLEPAATRL